MARRHKCFFDIKGCAMNLAILAKICRLSKIDDNPFCSGNISIMGNESELIVVAQLPNRTAKIFQFCRTVGGTVLGNQAIQAMRDAGLTVVD